MIPLFTRDEMRAIDRAASEQQHLPGLVLMENAGLGATLHILRQYESLLARVLVVGGEGQNGGDGWVVARQLRARGYTPTCVLLGDPMRVRGDARINLEALRALAVDIVTVGAGELDALVQLCGTATLIVDALFGTGLSRLIEGHHARAVEILNRSGTPICALDLPSGVDADRGGVLGVAVRARSTVTFAGWKRGLQQYPGVAHAGLIECVGIGVPIRSDADVAVIEARDVAGLLAPEAGDAHKGTRGHVVVIAGSEGKTGAALLAALGALRAGAGLVSVLADESTQHALEQKVLEVMTLRLDAADPLRSALASAEGKASAVLGPGFGLAPERRALARALALELPLPTVVDADALTAIAEDLAAIASARAPRVLTPHPGEAARLLGRPAAEVQADRFESASELARRAGQVVVLKGARTVIAAPDGRLRVSASGTPALGVAGTGDVLSGALAALLPRVSAFDAAWAAVELHARAGELAAAADRGLLASEVASALPRAFSAVRAAAHA